MHHIVLMNVKGYTGSLVLSIKSVVIFRVAIQYYQPTTGLLMINVKRESLNEKNFIDSVLRTRIEVSTVKPVLKTT